MLPQLGSCIELRPRKGKGKTVDKFSIEAASAPARPATWRLAVLVAAAFSTMAPAAEAAVEAATTLTNRIVCTTAPVNYNADGNPARVFVSGDFVYVLEQWNARVAVYDLNGRTNLFYYGATQSDVPGVIYTNSSKWAISTNATAFNCPFGMALDTFSGESRFAVADTGNDRVQLFTFDPATGAITFAAVSEKVFYQPNAVAFTESGDILVADLGNNRVVRLTVSGSSLTVGDTYPLGEKAQPSGICADGETGFWITDVKNQRVAYYSFADGTDSPAVFFGTAKNRELVTPRDVQIFGDSANGKFLCVVDNQGCRVRILEAISSGGAYTDVVAVGDVGSAKDAALQEYEKLFRPNGVFVDGGRLYVADYGHNLVKWYEVATESPDPPEPPKSFRFVSVETFDESGQPSTLFTNHQTIGLVVTFETDDEIEKATIRCDLTNGTTFVAIPYNLVSISGNTMSCDDISNASNVQPYYGPIDIVITAICANGNYTTNAVAAYTLYDPAPPAPAETTETNGWRIVSIVTDAAAGTATLGWDFPSADIVESGECLFEIQYRLDLVSGDWATLDSNIVATDASGCTYPVNLADLGNPPRCFFRLFWTNKLTAGD